VRNNSRSLQECCTDHHTRNALLSRGAHDVCLQFDPDTCRWGLALSLLFAPLALARAADVPTDPAARAKLIGAPNSLVVQPNKLALSGSRATAQPIVTGVYADGSVARPDAPRRLPR